MTLPKFCSECGIPFRPGMKFCAYCGTQLEHSVKEAMKTGPLPPLPSTPKHEGILPKKIEITSEEAEAILDSLVYTADAVTPWMFNNEIQYTSPDDLRSVDILIKVSERIMNEYPLLQSDDWLGYSTYQRTKKYLEDGDVDSLLAAKKEAGI